MEYHCNIPVGTKDIKKLRIGDILYVSGDIFTARDKAHRIMLEKNKVDLPFNPAGMGLYHCGPLTKKNGNNWHVVSAGPTTSGRMEPFEDKFIEKYGINLIIGKGDMGEKTRMALMKCKGAYTVYTGGAGALAADSIQRVKAVYFLEELGMTEAIWIFEVKEFGPLIVAIDSYGRSIYKELKKNRDIYLSGKE